MGYFSKRCKHCGTAFYSDFYDHCYNCILKEMRRGRKLQLVSNILIPGTHYEFHTGDCVPVDTALNLMRKLMAEKEWSEIEIRREIQSYPEFLRITEPEFFALYAKARELGPITISLEERRQLSLDKIHKVVTFAEAADLSKISPVILMCMKVIPCGQFSAFAKQYGVLLGEVPWPVFSSLSNKNIVKFLKSKEIWFQGCHLVKDGEIVRSKEFKRGWADRLRSVPMVAAKEQIEFIEEFILTNCPAPANSRFIFSDLIVQDNQKKLLWTRDANIAGREMKWCEASNFIKNLNQKKYAGYGDWRLPTTKELQSLTAFEIGGESYGHITGFKNVRRYYWSSTVPDSATEAQRILDEHLGCADTDVHASVNMWGSFRGSWRTSGESENMVWAVRSIDECRC